MVETRKKLVVDNAEKGGRLRFFKLAALSLLAIGLLGAVAVVGVVFYVSRELPSIYNVKDYRPLLGTMLYARDGTKIAEFAIEKRQIVAYERIPRLQILAFVAAEDQNFFDHFGIDPIGIMRAMVKNLRAGHAKEGASTITQQLARTFFLTREKKLTRKIKEAVLSLWVLERHLTKQEILWLYLNQIYLGHGAYGVQQAAQTYFGKNVWDLDVSEMAVLAGLPKAPGRDSPFVNLERGKKRRDYVLERMREEGYISEALYKESVSKPLLLTKQRDLFLETAPDFSEHVRKYLYDTFGENELYTGGLQVETTLNLDAQKYGYDAVYYGLRGLDRRQGWRGPKARIPQAKWSEFLKTLETKYESVPLERNKLFWGLVTDVDDTGKRATVKVGKKESYIPLEAMEWARHPDVDLFWEYDRLTKPSKALNPGDVVLVRPSDAKGIKKFSDYRSTEPIDPTNFIWALEQIPAAEAALLAKDPESGYTEAMIGGYAFERSEFNRAIQACRQPGSAFKPLVYTVAIDTDWTVSTPILDAPIVDGEWKEKWKPQNYDEDFKGEVSVRYALQHSLNIPAIKTIDHVGVHRVKEYAKKLGIRTEIQEDRSISLGSACVTPEDLVNVYSHYPLLGLKPRTVYIKTVTDRDGNILEDNRVYYDIGLDVAEKLDKMYQEVITHREQVLPASTAYIMTWLLRQVVEGGTASAAMALKRPCGGKTGTTNDAYDAWFVGFVPHLVAASWIGHDDNSRPLGRNETGGRAALPIWLDFMQKTLADAPVEEFPSAPGVTWATVDRLTGRQVAPGSTGAISVPFRAGTGPEQGSGEKGGVNPDEFYKMDQIY